MFVSPDEGARTDGGFRGERATLVGFLRDQRLTLDWSARALTPTPWPAGGGSRRTCRCWGWWGTVQARWLAGGWPGRTRRRATGGEDPDGGLPTARCPTPRSSPRPGGLAGRGRVRRAVRGRGTRARADHHEGEVLREVLGSVIEGCARRTATGVLRERIEGTASASELVVSHPGAGQRGVVGSSAADEQAEAVLEAGVAGLRPGAIEAGDGRPQIGQLTGPLKEPGLALGVRVPGRLAGLALHRAADDVVADRQDDPRASVGGKPTATRLATTCSIPGRAPSVGRFPATGGAASRGAVGARHIGPGLLGQPVPPGLLASRAGSAASRRDHRPWRRSSSWRYCCGHASTGSAPRARAGGQTPQRQRLQPDLGHRVDGARHTCSWVSAMAAFPLPLTPLE